MYIATFPLLMILFLVSVSALAEGMVCPEGSISNGETTPEVSEAWCEVMYKGHTVLHGPYRAWWPNGNIGNVGQYQYGKPVGLWQGWYESGELQGELWFEDGDIVKSRYLNKLGNETSKP